MTAPKTPRPDRDRDDGIDFESAVALLSQMVEIPSINPFFARQDSPPDWFGEARLAEFVALWLQQRGIEARLDEVLPGRPNVVARIRGSADAPSMIWEGHLDTVQVEGMEVPFSPKLVGRRLFGRGAVDDKGCLAMFMLALEALGRQDVGCDLTFVAAIDEEVSFQGVRHHIDTHDGYDFGVAGEPTSLRIVRACKGCVRWHVDVVGQAAHSSSPEKGIDSISAASDLIAHLRAYMSETESRHRHELLGGRTLTCTMISGGDGPNTLASHVRLTFDGRTLPDQTGMDLWTEIASVVADFERRRGRGAVLKMQEPFIDSISMEVDAGQGIVTALEDILGEMQRPNEAIGVAFGSDASKLTRADTPTVIFGPGHIEQAHASNEHVDVDELILGSRILVELSQRLASRT